MAITNFPDGVSSYGMPVVGQGVPIARAYKFVCSTYGSNGNDGTLEAPYATIDYAIGKCTASRGDTIVVMPGHTETVTAAGGIALDVAGVNIIGIGEGSIRPTVNFTTATTASFLVTAANCTVKNILFTGGVDALANPIHIQAADVTLDGCEWRDVTGQATDVILTTAAANRLKVVNHRHDGATAAGGASAIALVGGDRIRIENCRFDGNFSVGVIDIRTTATTDLEISNVVARTQNAADIFLVDTITGSTGMIGPNIYLRLNDNAANITEALTGATFVYFQPISIVNLAGESSMFSNITASTDA
jgi:hypothetical protein